MLVPRFLVVVEFLASGFLSRKYEFLGFRGSSRFLCS